ncbi:class II aldolase/adducin family protein [Sphingomonas immobilis]|uniref:Class II aldolase/adducin family protein n=1 Tax=Sphingomonas immobilis TaxID=3063997 RepID=A0ABT9A1F0_9SPHN|nr:class II aldolase/adducin family protein [Sphingomonas sp. CA1-15]MDO7843639.1 class II aldolase/adducin family protein [Sphingomonas sp. CA1-15]
MTETGQDFAVERATRKRSLAIAFRAFARHGFDMGLAGHITARDPEFADCFWVNPLGMHFSRITAGDLLLVDHNSKVIHGSGSLNRAAFAIHSAIHHARPDVIAACHAHSTAGRAFSAIDDVLLPLTQDSCAFFGDLAVYDEYSGVVFGEDEGVRIARTLGQSKAAILRNHGLLTVGQSVEEAAWWFLSLEDCCNVQLLARAAGTVKPMSQEAAAHTAGQVGTTVGGKRAFGPIARMIAEMEPDALEDVELTLREAVAQPAP